MTSTPIIINVLEADGYKNKHPRTNDKQVILPDGTRLQSYLKEAVQFTIVDGILSYKDPTTGVLKQVIQDPLTALPVGNVSNLILESLNTLANIKWTDPTDVLISSSSGDITVSKWGGTKVVLKEGSVPTDVSDGVLLLDSKERNSHTTVGLEIPNLLIDKVYFVKLFPYTESGVITNDDYNSVKLTTALVSLDPISDYTGLLSGTSLFIRMSEPVDKTGIYNGAEVSLAKWTSTKVIYKVGSAPTDHSDGTLISAYNIRNQHSLVGNELVTKLPVGDIFIAVYMLDDNGTWVNGRVASYKVTLSALSDVTGLSVTSVEGTVSVKWTDPVDVVYNVGGTDYITGKWTGTKIVRKIGSVPTSVTDGVLIKDSKVRDEHATVALTDDGLVEDTYFYRAFPYTDEGAMTNSLSGSVNVVFNDDLTGSPGSGKLLAGDMTAGFFGEVPNTELITPLNLATSVNLTAGVAQYNDTPWLKFSIDGKIIFVAKKPIRHSLSWNDIYNIAAVKGTKIIKIGENNYRLRLMRGATKDIVDGTGPGGGIVGSEWNRLMLPIHVNAKDQSWSVPEHAGTVPNWNIGYTDADLLTDGSRGSYSWCQEYGPNTNFHHMRGVMNVLGSGSYTSSSNSDRCGWRPVLELVDPSEITDTSSTPGSNILLSGNMSAGFFGEVPNDQLITPLNLANTIGLVSGVTQHNDTPWLKFAIDDKIIFVSKKPVRHSVIWNQINDTDAVKGSKIIDIGGNSYKVRLMRGALTDPSAGSNSDSGAIGSEWNRLMLPIHERAATGIWTYPQFSGTNVPNWGIGYTDADLVTHYSHGNGSYSWCQEVYGPSPAHRVVRGSGGVSGSDNGSATSTTTYYGWRPVLELVQ